MTTKKNMKNNIILARQQY